MRESVKILVRERANACCEYCKSPARFSPAPFSIEHIYARIWGGSDTLDNLAFSCQGCNNYKFTCFEWPDPQSGEVVAIFHPRHQNWKDHFEWDESCTLVVPLTSTGRATLARLKLNREELIDLRRVLVASGEHPID